MRERSLKAAFAVLAVLLVAVSAFAFLPVEDSEGVASKGMHSKITPQWVSSEVATLKTTTGEKIVDITVDFTELSDGSLRFEVQMRNASLYTNNAIKMVQYNDYGDTSSGSSKFNCAMKLEYFTNGWWHGFGGTNTVSEKQGMKGFMADFYVIRDSSSLSDTTPYSDSGTLRVDVKFNYTTIYDYVTELKYDINGGTSGPSSSTEKTESSETPVAQTSMAVSTVSDMKRDGHVFKGWSRSLDGSNLIQPGGVVTVPAGEATTLYAIWAEETVTVTLMDGDSVYEKLVVRKGAVPSLPSDLKKADSTFVGWYQDKGLVAKWDSSSTADSDLTLWAGWKPAFYFTTDPVADCKVTKLSGTTYLFDATVSKDYDTSAKVTSWSVLKDGEVIHESTGPYMTYSFMNYGTYEVQVKLVNDNGVESVHTETVTIEEPSSFDLKSVAVFLIVAVLIAVLVVRYLI